MQTGRNERIVIMGLSDHPERYAYKAAEKLQRHGYKNIVGIHPSQEAVLSVPVLAKIGELKEPIHTLTMYVGPSKSSRMVDEIVAAKPKRIIFNPGSECAPLAAAARAEGIEILEACTLVLLSISQF